jgi:hypothetical protein
MRHFVASELRRLGKPYGFIWGGIIRCREKIHSSEDWNGLPIGLTFIGLAFSVGTWHWWLEHKVGLYVWVLVVLGTCILSLITPNRVATFALLVFVGSYVSTGRFWEWLHGGGPGYVPLAWVLGTVFLVSIAPKWKLTAIVALGMWAILSIKAVLLDGEPRALIITAIAIALIIGILLTARDSDS